MRRLDRIISKLCLQVLSPALKVVGFTGKTQPSSSDRAPIPAFCQGHPDNTPKNLDKRSDTWGTPRKNKVECKWQAPRIAERREKGGVQLLPPSHRGRGLLQPVSAPLDSVTGSEVLVQLTPEVQKQVQGQEAPFSLLNIGQKRPSRLKGVQDVTVPLGNESFQVGVWLEEGTDGSLGKITLELMSKSQPHPRITRWGAGRSARWAEGSGVQSAASFAESQPGLFLKARGRPWEPGVRSPLPLPLPLGKPRAQFEPQFLHP